VCSGGKAVEGTLRRRWHVLGVGGVKDLKRASGKNLLSVERAARAPDIYNGGEMCDTRSLRRIAHFFRHVTHYLYMRDARLVRRIALLFPMGNMWIPNRRHTPIRRVALLFPMGNTWVPNRWRALISASPFNLLVMRFHECAPPFTYHRIKNSYSL
jgi:hypothetical protein